MSACGEKQSPMDGLATTVRALFHCAKHPAFRLGFLDAQDGRPFDHDAIMRRVFDETPPPSLDATRDIVLCGDREKQVEVAQVRYEEGRAAVIQYGCRCRAWSRPECPPKQLRELVQHLAKMRGGTRA